MRSAAGRLEGNGRGLVLPFALRADWGLDTGSGGIGVPRTWQLLVVKLRGSGVHKLLRQFIVVDV